MGLFFMVLYQFYKITYSGMKNKENRCAKAHPMPYFVKVIFRIGITIHIAKGCLKLFSGSLRPLQNIVQPFKNLSVRHFGAGRNPLNSDKSI